MDGTAVLVSLSRAWEKWCREAGERGKVCDETENIKCTYSAYMWGGTCDVHVTSM